MVKYIIIALFFSQLYCADLKYLTRSVVDETSFESVSNIISLSDNNSTTINIGFSFPFNGSNFNQITINSNGALNLENDGSFNDTNEELAYKNNSLYPYWYDLDPSRGGEVKYENKGDRFIISWEEVLNSNTFLGSFGNKKYTFQVVLYKSGDIRFRYDENSDANGKTCSFSMFGVEIMCNGATIGVEEDNNRFDQYSYEEEIDQTKDVLYLPIKEVNKDSCVIKDLINGTTNPKRIPSATIRYAIEVRNFSSSNMTDVIVEDRISSINKDLTFARNFM